jgi:hypothetical protein
MAYIQVEASVRTHPKFLKAGPAPSWLWLCGLAYCQEGLTDGFIPTEALPYLGVKNAAQLASHLVKAGLWHEAEGGWNVHDYLEHNRSAHEVATLKERRRAGGTLGGRPKTTKDTSQETLKVQQGKTLPQTSPEMRCDASASEAVVVAEDGQAAFMRFQAAYPGNRTAGGRMLMDKFLHQLRLAGGSARLFTALENHKASQQWSDPNLIPGMDKWLEQEQWRRVLAAKNEGVAVAKRPWAPLTPRQAS